MIYVSHFFNSNDYFDTLFENRKLTKKENINWSIFLSTLVTPSCTPKTV